MKKTKEGYTRVNLYLKTDSLPEIDKHIASLGLTIHQYIRSLINQDLKGDKEKND
jgi:predicted DNA binding CopG/RHH family protein